MITWPITSSPRGATLSLSREKNIHSAPKSTRKEENPNEKIHLLPAKLHIHPPMIKVAKDHPKVDSSPFPSLAKTTMPYVPTYHHISPSYCCFFLFGSAYHDLSMSSFILQCLLYPQCHWTTPFFAAAAPSKSVLASQPLRLLPLPWDWAAQILPANDHDPPMWTCLEPSPQWENKPCPSISQVPKEAKTEAGVWFWPLG